jgi:mRNA-degrading endonuclease RelE of RelBE toxin-antitoxin system
LDAGELELVPKAQLRAALRRIRDDPAVGKWLGGPLKGCQSVRIGGSENRLVYRLHGDLIEVLAVGRRRGAAVYGDASRRA